MKLSLSVHDKQENIAVTTKALLISYFLTNNIWLHPKQQKKRIPILVSLKSQLQIT